jgi:membrane protein DedA with SNARE-associated domain
VPTYIAVAAAGTIGYFAGSLVGWAAGRYGGRPLLERHARWFHLNEAKLARSERWFDRWGNLGVLIGRLTPLIRSFVSVAAGIFKMPLLPYSALTLVGSAIWAFALAGAGWVAGSSYGSVDHDGRYVEVGVGLLVLATLGFAAIRFHSRRRKLNAA